MADIIMILPIRCIFEWFVIWITLLTSLVSFLGVFFWRQPLQIIIVVVEWVCVFKVYLNFPFIFWETMKSVTYNSVRTWLSFLPSLANVVE